MQPTLPCKVDSSMSSPFNERTPSFVTTSRMEGPMTSQSQTPRPLKTLFLQAPSFEGFDGGAGSRYQAKREIKSFWFPTWLAQPPALAPDSRVVDAPADELTVEQTRQIARGYELVIMHTSTPSFPT